MVLPKRSVIAAIWLVLASPLAGMDLFDAIVQVENPNGAISKRGEVGPAQITSILVRDLNRIYGTKFTLNDAYSLDLSRQMFWLYTNHYIKTHEDTPRNRALLWHLGPSGPRAHPNHPYGARVCSLLAAYGS